MIDVEPQTDAELFDFIHSLFGIGDFTEDDKKPWHRFRMTEIAKIKAIRKKRRISIDELAAVARYAGARGYVVTSTFDLLKHFPDAMRERRRNTKTPLVLAVEAAIELEREYGDPEWVDRLDRSSGAGRIDLLQEWRSTRERTLTDRRSTT